MILIDAESPKTCNECPLWYDDDDCCHQYCVLTDKEITDIKYLGKDGDCPLVDEGCTGAESEDKGEISDGYHTFNQLYHQRAVLFATIVNQNKSRSWKSYKHSDGQYCFDSNGEWFIVGIDTPQGTYTYHYSKEYWDMFDCQELECGKEWDGHTEEDVIRLLSLQQESCDDAISREAVKSALCELCGLHGDEKGCPFINGDCDDLNAINALPPVIPKKEESEEA